MRTFIYGAILFLFIGLLAPFPTHAQFEGLSSELVVLEDLKGFQPTGQNWQVVGKVTADRSAAHTLSVKPGTGVLVNRPSKEERKHLFTTWTHGDLQLEMDVLMPKGSNSGIYLQGRYEIQLLDSWGVKHPTFSDMGGIYQRWDSSRPDGQKGYQGQPPRMNVARAPGLWQHLTISFKAPRFNDQGEKTANARFERVELNGVVIHENVELTGPTRAAAFQDEQPRGPLMIQGDHGPVAVRNIRYKRLERKPVILRDLQYRLYKGSFNDGLNKESLVLQEKGKTKQLSSAVTDASDNFALSFDGTVEVPADGKYFFALNLNWVVGDPHFSARKVGGGYLMVGGRKVVQHPGRQAVATGQVELEAGRHPFELTYFKNRSGGTGMSLWTEGPGVRRQELTAPNSFQRKTPPDPIRVDAGDGPMVLRSFQHHKGEKRTHVASVGTPAGTHFSYDLKQGALLKIWKGSFLSATKTWHGRAFEQVTKPLGSVINFPGTSVLSLVSGNASRSQYLGYAVDGKGFPTFSYRHKGLTMHDRLMPALNGQGLTRRLQLKANQQLPKLWLRIAQANQIVQLADGSYLVGQGQYYISFGETGHAQPLIHTENGQKELRLPVEAGQKQSTVTYSIIW